MVIVSPAEVVCQVVTNASGGGGGALVTTLPVTVTS